MKATTILTFFTLFAVAACTSCKKNAEPAPDNPYGLPNATQSGANVFAYLNNGVPQIAKNSIYTMGGGVKNDTLYATGESGDANYFESLGLAISGGLKKDSIYPIYAQKNVIKMVTNKSCLGYLGSNVITAFATSGSILPLKIDLQNKIISGTFNCKIPIANCDTVKITEGRFDIKY